MAVSSVNKVQEAYSVYRDFVSGTARSVSLNALSNVKDFSDVKREVSDASEVVYLLASMDMSAPVRQRCHETTRTLKRMRDELGIRGHTPSPRSSGVSIESPVFTAPRSASTGFFSQLGERLAESPKAVPWLLCGIRCGLCSILALVSDNTQTTTNINAASNSSSSNKNAANNTGGGTSVPVTQAATLTPSPTPTPKIERPQTGALMSRGSRIKLF